MTSNDSIGEAISSLRERHESKLPVESSIVNKCLESKKSPTFKKNLMRRVLGKAKITMKAIPEEYLDDSTGNRATMTKEATTGATGSEGDSTSTSDGTISTKEIKQPEPTKRIQTPSCTLAKGYKRDKVKNEIRK